MWQEIIAYTIVAAVVLIVVGQQIKRHRRPESERCDNNACDGCTLKNSCASHKQSKQ
ncbi:MAG: hypothetical protein Q4D14_03180 [Bacteroidales bacterium]|nr:hypothetical protein [Bacteroidales bacterium]